MIHYPYLLHTHTNYCDGKHTPEKMVQAAIAAGCKTIGFTEHSFVPFDPSGGMSPAQTTQYQADILALKEKYRNQIEIPLGLEIDFYSPTQYAPYLDYDIGAVHYLYKNGTYYSVDETPKKFEQCICALGGSIQMINAYYETVVAMAQKRPAILAHFDLITKFNHDSRYFSQNSLHYQKTALKALEEAAKNNVVFEINTGAIARGWKDFPYPSPFLLHHLAKMDAPVIISTDAHCTEHLTFGINESLELLKECGFKRILVYENGNFLYYPLHSLPCHP